MSAVIYCWRLEPGAEESLVEGWTRVTSAIHARCSSYGSPLHRAPARTWVAYARGPDAATREACRHGPSEGARMMREAVGEDFDEWAVEVTVDLLGEPRG